MSHFTTIETQIRDPEALALAVSELGLKLERNGVARGYAGNELPGDYVIRCKGRYDIAVKVGADGRLGLTCDWWQGDVEREVGAGYKRLIQLYGVHKASVEARRKGLVPIRHKMAADGSIKLSIQGMR